MFNIPINLKQTASSRWPQADDFSERAASMSGNDDLNLDATYVSEENGSEMRGINKMIHIFFTEKTLVTTTMMVVRH